MNLYKKQKLEAVFQKMGYDYCSFEDLFMLIGDNEKYAIWIANVLSNNSEFYNIDSWDGNNTDLISLKSKIDTIISWKKENPHITLRNDDSFDSCYKVAEEYFTRKNFRVTAESSENSGNIFINFGEYKWVELTTIESIQEEGEKMKNCLRDADNIEGYTDNLDFPIYSLRDKNNKPHITVAVDSREVVCIEGVCGGNFHPKLIPYVETLFYKLKFKKFYVFGDDTTLALGFIHSLAGGSLKEIIAFLKRYKKKTTEDIFNEFLIHFFKCNPLYNNISIISKILIDELHLPKKQIEKIMSIGDKEVFSEMNSEDPNSRIYVQREISNTKKQFRFLKAGETTGINEKVFINTPSTIKNLVPIQLNDNTFIDFPIFKKLKKITYL